MGRSLASPSQGSRTASLGSFSVTNFLYDPDAVTLFARMSVQPDAQRKQIISNLISRLKAIGTWPKRDAIAVLAAHDAQAARLNWKSSSFDLTAVNSPTFTTDRGYAGNGTTSYLNTNYIPSTNGVTLTQNSASIGFYVNATGSDISSASVINLGSQDPTQGTYCVAWRASAGAGGKMNDNTAGTVGTGISTRLGMTMFDRSAAGTRAIYRNGASAGTASVTSVGRATVAMYLGAFNNNGVASGFITDRHAIYVAGGSLTASEYAAEYAAFLTYLQQVGGS